MPGGGAEILHEVGVNRVTTTILATATRVARAQVETRETKREELQGQANALNQNLSDRRTSHSVTQVKLEEAAARQQQIRQH